MAVTYNPWVQGDPPPTAGNGIINANDLEVTADTGMDIAVASGDAWIRGTFNNDASATLTVASNSSGDTRYDLVVARVTLGTSTASLAIKEGQVQPTQTQNGTWELPLAVITVGDSVSSIGMGDIADLRVVQGDMTPKSLVTLNYDTNVVLSPGDVRTMQWNNTIYDPQQAQFNEGLIKVRQTAWYEVKCQFRWEPDNDTGLPLRFDVWGGDKDDARVYNIFNSASVQLSTGNVDYIFQRNFLLPQGDFVFCTVTNTTDENITLKSVGMGASPQIQLNIEGYNVEVL